VVGRELPFAVSMARTTVFNQRSPIPVDDDTTRCRKNGHLSLFITEIFTKVLRLEQALIADCFSGPD